MKMKKAGSKTKCANCGKRHNLRPAYVGYEDQALCAVCERESYPELQELRRTLRPE